MKLLKKSICILSVLCLLLQMPVVSFAVTTPDANKSSSSPQAYYEDGIFHFRDSDDGKSMMIVGIDYDNEDSSITIPSKFNGKAVTEISNYAFDYRKEIETVNIPNSVRIIGNEAFCDCRNLKTVSFSANTESIGEGAFSGCNNLILSSIPSKTKIIGKRAFADCNSITGISIPKSVTIIGAGAFAGCKSLRTISVASDNPKYTDVDGVLYTKDLKTIMAFGSGRTENSFLIPASVTSVVYAFGGCSNLTNITIPDTVTTLSDASFSACTSLESITIPDSVQEIGDSLFEHCSSLNSVVMSSNITETSDCMFYNCDELTDIVYGNITSIGYYSYGDCDGLTDIVIPDTVEYIGPGAFAGCSNLRSVIMSDNLNELSRNAFEYCESLESITIPGSVKSIDYYTFGYCSNLKSAYVSEGVESISGDAFYGCEKLENISFPNTLVNLSCYSIVGTAYYNNPSNWQDGVLYVGGALVASNDDLSGSYTVKNGTYIIADYAFYRCDNLTKLTLPAGLTHIGSGAVEYCSSLATVNLPAGLKKIADYAFNGCDSLSAVSVPESVTEITYGCFKDCEKLASVTLPNNLQRIGARAFQNTEYFNTSSNWKSSSLINKKYLIKVKPSVSGTYTVNSRVKVFADEAFSECDKLTSVVIPEGITTLSNGLFYNCEKLSSVFLPSTLTSIKESALGKTTWAHSDYGDYDYRTEVAIALDTVFFAGSKSKADAITIENENHLNDGFATAFWYYNMGPDIYNLGEETYGFVNFANEKSCKHKDFGGHCFGMAATSSGYYLGILDKSSIGANNKKLFSLSNTDKIRTSICHYLKIQGSVGPLGSKGAEREAIVAGGSLDLIRKVDTASDWTTCVNYVKNHEFDYKGTLNVGIWYKDGSGHAVNFLYYKEVNGQQRIYVYDNNYPNYEMYFYKSGSYIYENSDAPEYSDGKSAAIKGMDLMDVATYFSYADRTSLASFIFGTKNSIEVENAEYDYLKCGDELSDYVVYKIPKGAEEVTITPLEDNASFDYMGVEYTFGNVDEDTFGTLEVLPESAEEGEKTEFVIENVPPRVQIKNFVAERTEAYRTSITFTAAVTDPNDDVTVHWFVNGKDSGTGETFKVEEAKADYTVQAKFINKSGKTEFESKKETVKIKSGIFDKIIWFFVHLFNPDAYDKKQ